MSIDSYRFLDFATRQVMKAWAARQKPGEIPFTPLAKPLGECTVAVLSTAAVARHDDRPFDQERERRDPWWGDPSFRVIPLGTTERDVRLYHMHIDPRFGAGWSAKPCCPGSRSPVSSPRVCSGSICTGC